jgi:hypothetical protein
VGGASAWLPLGWLRQFVLIQISWSGCLQIGRVCRPNSTASRLMRAAEEAG